MTVPLSWCELPTTRRIARRYTPAHWQAQPLRKQGTSVQEAVLEVNPTPRDNPRRGCLSGRLCGAARTREMSVIAPNPLIRIAKFASSGLSSLRRVDDAPSRMFALALYSLD